MNLPGATVIVGNVEPSQHGIDYLFGALGAMVSAQRTMNNLTFSNATYQYYGECTGFTSPTR